MDFNIKTVVDAIVQTVGYEQTVDTVTYPLVDAVNLVDPNTYQSVNQEHPAFIKVENVFHTLTALGTNPQNITPTAFNAALSSKRIAAASNLLQDFRTSYVKSKLTKSVLEDRQIFKGVGRLKDTVINSGRLVGWVIQLKDMAQSLVNLKNIGFQSTAIENFNMYLFHSSQPESIATIPISTANPNGFAWTGALNKLMFNGTEHNSGGFFFLGYYQNDLNGQAVNLARTPSTSPISWSCSACPETRSYKRWSKYCDFYATSFINPPAVGVAPDFSAMTYDSRNTYGMNLDISITCDITKILVERAVDFTTPLKKKMASMILLDLYANPEVDGLSNIMRQQAETLYKQKEEEYKTALEALVFDLSGLSEPCLPAIGKKSFVSMSNY